MRRSRVRLLVAAPFWKEGSGKKDARLGEDECVLVFVTHGWFVKAVGNENESGVKREYDAPLVLRI